VDYACRELGDERAAAMVPFFRLSPVNMHEVTTYLL
jgi:hypothetical protein